MRKWKCTLHFPHSALNSYSAHFPHFAFLTLCFFHTLHFPHSSLHIFHQTCLMVMHSLNIAVVSLGQIHDLRGVLEIQTANGGPQQEGILPWEMFLIEILRNRISGILRSCQHVRKHCIFMSQIRIECSCLYSY